MLRLDLSQDTGTLAGERELTIGVGKDVPEITFSGEQIKLGLTTLANGLHAVETLPPDIHITSPWDDFRTQFEEVRNQLTNN